MAQEDLEMEISDDKIREIIQKYSGDSDVEDQLPGTSRGKSVKRDQEQVPERPELTEIIRIDSNDVNTEPAPAVEPSNPEADLDVNDIIDKYNREWVFHSQPDRTGLAVYNPAP